MADATTSGSAEGPVKDNHADVDAPGPTTTADAPVVPDEEPGSDPVNTTLDTEGNVTRITLTITRLLTLGCHSDAIAAPTATNDVNGDNQDINMNAAAETAKGETQAHEGAQSIIGGSLLSSTDKHNSGRNKRCNACVI